ncbi:MAG: YigZ family protein, partial [Firmicutes bacterium]|nr:YigZ family protein [Bacillota bacterium]
MKYLKEKITHQIEINKSVFITILYPLEHQEDIQKHINEAKKIYPKANHYCSASIYGESQEHATANDDGEPSRTAGIPILEVLKHHDVTNILCVIVRYFGGIKLGTGGLVRAYTKAAADAIKDIKLYVKRIVPAYVVEFDYALINQIDHYFEKKVTILEKSFLTTVTYKIVLLENNHSI